MASHKLILIDVREGNGEAGGWVVRCSNEDCCGYYEVFRLKRDAISNMKGQTCPEGKN
jgi:hypothetical protein